MYDVIAVDIKTKKLRILATEKTEEAAEAFINFAVMRRGCDKEIYVKVPLGKYTTDGQTYRE